MKILVLVKEVPDTYGDRKLSLETGLAERSASERVLDEVCERAVDAAVESRKQHPDAEVIVLTMGPPSAQTALRKAMAMGADHAYHVVDERLAGADISLTADVLAAAVARVGDVDVVMAGNGSTDGQAGVIPAMVAELLGRPSLTFLSAWELTADAVTGTRTSDEGNATVSAALPAVVSVTEAFPDPRMPNFKGIMAAKKKPSTTWTLEDLGVSADPAQPRSIMTAVVERPPRAAGVKIVDDGDAGKQLAAYLIEKGLV